VDVSLSVGRLVGDEQLDCGPEERVREAACRDERLVLRPELGSEKMVDDVEHLGPGAVVLRQGEHAGTRGAALAEDFDVRVAEAVDRLELVADEEDLLARDEVDELQPRGSVVEVVEEPLAAAIGANVPISGPSGNLVIDIGGGTSEIAVISLGGIVVARSVRVGGNRFDEAIANYVRKKYNVMIGDRTAEEVKMQIGTAMPLERELHMEVRGRDLIAGLPRTVPLTSSEVMEALEQPLQQIIGAVRAVLEETPPELSSDIIDKGMVMTGGGSLLRNIDKLLTQVTGVPCHVAENALNCVALGTGLALEHFDFFRKSLVQRI